MKLLFGYLFSLLLLGSIFIGCSDQQAPTAGTDNTAPVLMKPGSGGAEIVRYQGEYWVWFRDVDAGYTLFLGNDMREYCQFDRIVGMSKGDDIRAFVWIWSDPTTQGCAYYTSTDPIAIGTAKVINTDNDLYMWAEPERKNANSYGWRVNGTLEGPEGQVYNLSAHFLNVWKWSWPADGSQDKLIVKINLTPVGGGN